MSWNTNQNSNGSQSNRRNLRCNSENYDITGLNGVALSEKIKAIARDDDISKFDIFDSLNNNIAPEQIEAGQFTGDLTLVRFNVAAA